MHLRTNLISDAPLNEEVFLCGWAHEVRLMPKMAFIVLRDKSGTIQATFKKELLPEKFSALSEIVKETPLQLKGKAVESKIAKSGREFLVSEFKVLGQVTKKIPIDVTGRVPAEIDTRLDNRCVDLRTDKVQAIFKIRSQAMRSFREFLLENSFQEITPPCIVGESTEGGTDLFELKYFEKKAFLAQSPQLYKQLAVLGGMDRVFMITPIFRAEKHNTVYHLNECTQMDLEMGFCDGYSALDILEKAVIRIISDSQKKCSKELELLQAKVSVPKKVPRKTYSELVALLQTNGENIEWGEDFTKEQEKKMCSLVGEELFSIVDWPTSVRSFYCMPFEDKPEICKAYDVMYKGLEISSGAQRIHVPEMIEEQLNARGISLKGFESYIDSFRYGAIPHAGGSIGAERITMMLADQKNIRECVLFPRDRNRLVP